MKTIFTEIISSELENKKVVHLIQPLINSNTVFLFKGGLGVGKTTFVRNLVENFVPFNHVQSPTFSFRNSYVINPQLSIEHFDLYRIETNDDLESIGFWEVFSETNKCIFIEWSEKLNEADLPLNWKVYILSLEKLKDDAHSLTESRRFILSSF